MSSERKIHVFIDISNIVCGARDIKKSSKIELDVPALFHLVKGGREVARKVAVGSVHPSFSQKQLSIEESPWKAANFEVTLLQRVQTANSTGRYSEQSVDDLLHAAIQEDLLKTFVSPRTLVLLTGDGNINGGRTSFPKVIQDALLRNWNVEVWAWDKSISPTYYRMEQVYSPNFVVNLLEKYINRITINIDEKRPTHPIGIQNTNTKRNAIQNEARVVPGKNNQNNIRAQHQQQQQKQQQNYRPSPATECYPKRLNIDQTRPQQRNLQQRVVHNEHQQNQRKVHQQNQNPARQNQDQKEQNNHLNQQFKMSSNCSSTFQNNPKLTRNIEPERRKNKEERPKTKSMIVDLCDEEGEEVEEDESDSDSESDSDEEDLLSIDNEVQFAGYCDDVSVTGQSRSSVYGAGGRLEGVSEDNRSSGSQMSGPFSSSSSSSSSNYNHNNNNKSNDNRRKSNKNNNKYSKDSKNRSSNTSPVRLDLVASSGISQSKFLPPKRKGLSHCSTDDLGRMVMTVDDSSDESVYPVVVAAAGRKSESKSGRSNSGRGNGSGSGRGASVRLNIASSSFYSSNSRDSSASDSNSDSDGSSGVEVIGNSTAEPSTLVEPCSRGMGNLLKRKVITDDSEDDDIENSFHGSQKSARNSHGSVELLPNPTRNNDDYCVDLTLDSPEPVQVVRAVTDNRTSHNGTRSSVVEPVHSRQSSGSPFISSGRRSPNSQHSNQNARASVISDRSVSSSSVEERERGVDVPEYWFDRTGGHR